MANKKILIADDDPDIVDALRLMLELAHYEVAATVDNNIMPMIKREKPDLVLLDISMSGVDGREICKQLKKDKKTKQIPIIMISANRDVKKSTRDSGADDFLEKPFEMDELIGKVKKCFETPEAN